ncbi:MAG: DNA-protecting protein DprA, partial [Pirellulaceae bacterium]|nr:DNA-protecting protein DprA [Pirellulaceae bacterium]
MDLPKLAHRLGLVGVEAAERIADARRRAEAMLAAGSRGGLHLIAARTPAYPARLWEIPDPPIVLWARGAASLDCRSVAIVGSRRSTPTGLMMARKLGSDLASAGWTIVSGLALGVDGAAHEAALDAGGETVAVLGCGADVVYPSEHRGLAERIVASGRILSEFPPGTAPRPWHFPLRNRIISGLVQAVVVVEASEKSGSLITARLAMEQGRDVLAVPGSAASGRYRGSHALIKDGARLVESVDDVLDELEGVSRESRARSGGKPPPLSKLEETMAMGEPYSADDLAALTGRPAPELLAELGSLEVQGRIGRAGGGNFVRLDAAAS